MERMRSKEQITGCQERKIYFGLMVNVGNLQNMKKLHLEKGKEK